MDPLGFALEHYDAVGQQRSSDEGKPIDAHGELASGAGFDGVAELEQALLKQPDWFAHCFVEKLFTYALGRGLQPSDGAMVRRIVRSAKANDYRFSSIVAGITESDAFLRRENAEYIERDAKD